ncbi:MAG: PTS sugar transporter subunit IIA [Candidatus Cloacimonetes bacterium]|nr:PTS sugar transporter subunit IIA [Candidatus Cloacimonadota bacterium]
MWKDIVNKNLIIINPDVKNKKELFEAMVNHAYNRDYIRNKKQFLKALIEREEMANTELIEGIALPHARSDSVEKIFMSIIIFSEGLDYGNKEMGPAKIIFFFGCSEAHNKEYLQLLAQSNRLLRKKKFRDALLLCKTKENVIDILAKYDEEKETVLEKEKYILIMTLNNTDKSDEVMNSMIEVGITNASILDSTSMARKLAYEMPVFAGLSYMAQGKNKKSNVIIAHVENKNTVNKLADLLKENGIDLDKRGVGFIQLIRVDNIIGNHEEDIDL